MILEALSRAFAKSTGPVGYSGDEKSLTASQRFKTAPGVNDESGLKRAPLARSHLSFDMWPAISSKIEPVSCVLVE